MRDDERGEGGGEKLHAPEPAGPPPFPLSLMLVVPVVMGLAGWVLGAPLVLAAPWVVPVLCQGGPAYAVIASCAAVVLRLRAAKEVRAPGTAVAPRDVAIASGQALSQRATRASATALLVLWVVVAVAFAIGVGPGLMVVFGGPAIVGAVVSIIANARLLYSPRIARAEVAEVIERGPGRPRILANWILAPLSWFAFAIPVQFIDGLAGG